ncbi:hypothetical protein [Micromonospora sp. 4G55]|uniref:hypothetical protein n=1 Tax=Micromonospora sp. 4G55 TaxID=2806102 RepID=UPI001A5176E7|nr:hypothetical protein [Micromonospora sp. 4G55]MBM0260464.1 hypothetical protein [Micromonospora sp. 4G55]
MTSADLAATAAPRPPGRALARTQFLLVGAYLVAVGVALGRAAAFSGRLYLPRQGDDATGNADLWPGLWGGVWLVLVVVIGLVPRPQGARRWSPSPGSPPPGCVPGPPDGAACWRALSSPPSSSPPG